GLEPRQKRRLELVEDRLDLVRLHPRLVVVEHDVVLIVRGLEAGDVLPTRLASNDSGSCASSNGRSSSSSSPRSGETCSSCAIRFRVARCSARGSAPSGGIFVSSSHERTPAAFSTSWISPRRRFSSSKRFVTRQ